MRSSGRRMLVAAFAFVAGVLRFMPTDSAAAPESPCGSVFSNGTGTIDLPNDLQMGACNFTIMRDNTTKYTSLVISKLMMQKTDYVVFYDNVNKTNIPVANITGSSEPFLVVISAPAAYVEVMLSANNTESTMTVDYSTKKCEQKFPSDRASLVRSPFYLSNRTGFVCVYSSSENATGIVALSFQEFDLPNATLNITKTGGETNPVLEGTSLPSDVFANDTLQMTLTVPDGAPMQNFMASVAPITENCYMSVTVNGSEVLTLTLPELHGQTGDCRIAIKALKQKSLLLNITALQLARFGDRLTIIDGSSLAGHVLDTLTQVPAAGYILVSSGQSMVGRLVLDNLPMSGPRVVNIIITEQVAGQHIFVEGPLIMTSPPVANGTSVSEYYVLEAPPGKQVKFDLGAEVVNTSYSYVVSAYDGNQPVGTPIVSFRSSRRFSVVSSGITMLVVVTRMNIAQDLTATISFVSPGCNQVSTGNQGDFALMGSSALTPPCVWTIAPTASVVGTIVLEISPLTLPVNTSVTVYSGLQKAGVTVAKFQTNNTGPGVMLPQIAIPASAYAQLVFSASENGTNMTQAVIKARYQVISTDCGGQLTAKQGVLTSPDFPNQYPLNSLCIWTIPQSVPERVLFFDFPSFQLAPDHVVKMVESVSINTTNVLATFGGSKQPADLIYKSNSTVGVTFSAQVTNGSGLKLDVGQGFSLNYWMLDCGGNVTMVTAKFATPGYPNVSTNPTLCVWIVHLLPKSGADVNIVNMTLSVKVSGGAKAKDIISLFDGDSLRAPPLNANWTGESEAKVLSRYNTVIIVVNFTAAATNPVGFAMQASYSTYACSKEHQCDNGVCMHPDWRCNGLDDCGDGTDERNCTSTPSADTSGLVRSYWVPICIFIGLILGVVFAFLVPRIIRKFRGQPYTPFRDEPVIT